MSTDTSPSGQPDSRPLFRLIGQTRLLLRSSWVLTGLGLTLGLLLGSLVAMTLIDLFLPLEPITLPFVRVVIPLDPIVRTLALLLIVVPAVLAFLQGVVRPLFRRLAPTQVARRIEARLPGIHNRLVSAIDLETRHPGTASPIFLRRLLTEALARVRGFSPFSIIDRRSLGRAGLLAGASLAACLLVGLAFRDYLPTTLQRIFFPFADIPPASRVAYTVTPGSADVLREEEITFSADVTHGAPTSLRLDLYSASGTSHTYDLKADPNDPSSWKVTVDAPSLGKGFENGFSYRVYGGRTWSPKFGINLVERPVLASVRTAVHYPAYMRLPESVPTPPDAVEVTGPEGGAVEVLVQAQGQVGEGEIQLLEADIRSIPRDRQQMRVYLDEKLPVGATSGGTWDWQQADKHAVHVEPAGIGTRGHWFQGDPVGHVVGKGDVLFAYLRFKPEQTPQTAMLEWHDGDGWEHRAFWGADLIHEGRAGTASRFHAGDLPTDLPPAGRWVRLEVPAAKVGLEGKTIRGMAFKLHGGQAAWGRVGSVQVEEPGVRVVKTFPLKKGEDDLWAGKFPLHGKGLFRAELRNRAGHPNKPMKELKFLALPDKAPYVALDRQSVEMVLSKPASVPLSISAFDDYGLDEIAVLHRPTPTAPYTKRVLRKLDRPERTVALVSSLEEGGKLSTGGVMRYLIEVRDTKGQTARTPEFVLRIAADANAEDKKLEAFDKVQDTFQDRLAKLIGEQKKVQAELEKADKEYAKVAEKVREKEDEARAEAEKKPGYKPEDKPQPKLTPEEQKKLEELRKELAKLAGEQERNAKAAEEIGKDLKKTIEDAGKLDLLPKPLAAEMKATERLFDRMVTEAMKDLGKKLAEGADAKKDTADTSDLKNKGERIGKELDGLKERLDALAKARKGLKEDVEKALAALQEKMLKEDSKLTARDLEQLKDFINKLREQMKAAGEKSDALDRDPPDGDPKKMADKKADVEKDLEDLLAKAKKLLAKSDKGRKPEFPDAPFRDEKEETVPPREEDSNEPLPKKKGAEKKPGEKDSAEKKPGEKKDGEDEEEPKFMPRLGGPKPKLDPRFDKKRRPMKKGPKEKGDEKEGDEKEGDEKRGDLDSAEKSLEADANTLEAMIDALKNPGKGKGKPKEGSEPQGPESEAAAMARQLREMLESAQTKEASMMAKAAKALGQARSRSRSDAPKTPNPMTPPTEGDKEGKELGPASAVAGLEKLDPATRAMLIKMPPSRFRDELIQGLNERGPEAYEAFIQDYFKRLTETRPAPK